MSQNRSHAVMAQRHEPPDSLDFFPTPPWATRALLTHCLAPRFQDLHLQVVHDPACGAGDMARPLAEVFGEVIATDIFDYGWPNQVGAFDYLLDYMHPALADVDWVITNPPFKVAPAFIRMALRRARIGVAMLVRRTFDEGAARYKTLFRDTPPAFNIPFAERVVMHRGILRDPDVNYWDPNANDGQGAWKKPSTATAYGWLVWLKIPGTIEQVIRIPICRRALTRPGDYPVRLRNDTAPQPLLDKAAG